MRVRRAKGSGVCSTCGGRRDRPGQRTCSACHSEYMRQYHKGVTVKKTNRMHIRFGVLPPEPCCPMSEPCSRHMKKPRRQSTTKKELDAIAKGIRNRTESSLR